MSGFESDPGDEQPEAAARPAAGAAVPARVAFNRYHLLRAKDVVRFTPFKQATEA